MAITGYTVSYSFSGFQASNPDTPLPAAQIDNELAGVSASITAIIAAVDGVRRSDGRLQNSIVSFDSLDDQVKALLDLDPRVTVPDINPAAFAVEVEAQTGVATDKLMHPLATKQAIDAQRPFATQAEAEAGLVNTALLSPLRGKQEIEALRPWATFAEAEAGEVAGKVMTPQRTRDFVRSARRANRVSAVLTWAELAAGASATQTVAVPLAEVGDRVVVGLPAGGLPAGVVYTAWVSASEVVTIRLTNTTAGALTPTAAQTYFVTNIGF